MFAMQSRAVFVGNGFTNSQLLFVIPFVDGYASERGIHRLIFERELSKEVVTHDVIKPILDRYEIKYQFTHSHPLVRRLLILFRLFFTLGLPLIHLTATSSRRYLLGNVRWYECQLRHAVWDQALQAAPDGAIEMSFMRRLAAAVRVLGAVQRAKQLVLSENVVAAVLGHAVYAGRGLLAKMRQMNVDVICHAGNVFHRQYSAQDTSWSLLPRQHWDLLQSLNSEGATENFWAARVEGKSSYLEARLASRRKKTVSETTPKNILFLHIFRDSPFNNIDRTRIFADYVEWVVQTLSSLRKSQENWLIRLHPGAGRWGEDQMTWLKAIGERVFRGRWPENIEIDNCRYSTVDLLKQAKRVVTYRGTVDLEAACFGLRPIIISEVALSCYDPELVLKPMSLIEYEELILTSSDQKMFKLNSEQIQLARRLLHVREELLSFKKEVGSLPVSRGDKKSISEADFRSVSGVISQSQLKLREAGIAVARGLPRTVSLSFLDRWSQLYFDIANP